LPNPASLVGLLGFLFQGAFYGCSLGALTLTPLTLNWLERFCSKVFG
jgi:hypothetical protein